MGGGPHRTNTPRKHTRPTGQVKFLSGSEDAPAVVHQVGAASS